MSRGIGVVLRSVSLGATAGVVCGGAAGVPFVFIGAIPGACIGAPVGLVLGLVNGLVLVPLTLLVPPRWMVRVAAAAVSAIGSVAVYAIVDTLHVTVALVLALVSGAAGAWLGPHAAWGSSPTDVPSAAGVRAHRVRDCHGARVLFGAVVVATSLVGASCGLAGVFGSTTATGVNGLVGGACAGAGIGIVVGLFALIFSVPVPTWARR